MFVFILLNKLLNLIQSNNDQKSNGFWYKFEKKIGSEMFSGEELRKLLFYYY